MHLQCQLKCLKNMSRAYNVECVMKMRIVKSGVMAKLYKFEVRCNAPDVHSAPRASSSFSKQSEKKEYDTKEEE